MIRPIPSLNARRIVVGLAATMSIAPVVGGGMVPGNAAAAEPLRGLPAPKHMTSEALVEFKARMGRHGNTMSTLVRAVVLLDRPSIRTLASRIADEEIIARATSASWDTRRYPLPNEFFDQQDTLRAAAQNLAVAAAVEGDDQVLADHFANVARTCVSCHSVFLHHDPLARPTVRPNDAVNGSGRRGVPPSPGRREPSGQEH